MRVLLASALLLLGGCGGEDPGSTPVDDPTLGGERPTAAPPAGEMDQLERPIAELLSTRVAEQGLRVDALRCPEWDGDLPAEMVCDGWFDGVKGKVAVELWRAENDEVGFDAELMSGVIATQNLVDELVDKGYEDVDCGDAPAYPTEVGSTITCAVSRDGTDKHVVATVTDEQGAVMISDFSA